MVGQGIWDMHGTQLSPPLHPDLPTNTSEHWSIGIHCDNLGIIEQLSNKTTIQYPRDAIHDIYPIFMEIETQIQQLHPIIPKFHHVKGHQNTKSN